MPDHVSARSADALKLVNEDAARVDALFIQEATGNSSSGGGSRNLTQVEASNSSEESRLTGGNTTSDAGLDPLAVAAHAPTDALADPALAGAGDRHPRSGPRPEDGAGVNILNAGNANGLAGIGSGVGGTSTGGSSGGGGSAGGSGGGGGGTVNQLNALGIQGAFSSPASVTSPTATTAAGSDPVMSTFAAAQPPSHASPALTPLILNPPPDAPPVPNNDSYSVVHDRLLLTGSTTGVLANDTNADGDPLTASLVGSGTSHGLLSLSSNGSVFYTPNKGYVDPDSFQYQASDGRETSNTATVTINVTDNPPVANNDSYSVGQNQILLTGSTTGVLANDTDADGDTLTASLFGSGPSHGQVSLGSNGSVTYTPNQGYVGADSFQYHDFDGAEYSNTATVTLNITPTATLTDVDGASASATSTVVVGNIASGVPATMGSGVWEFDDANTYAQSSDFASSSINWGDGTSVAGTVTGGPGNGSGAVIFGVAGTHTYGQDSVGQLGGQYPMTVTATDVDGSTLSGTQYVSVVRPNLSLSVANVDIASSLTVSNVQVAAFSDPAPGDSASEFTAQIDWGDGSSGSGTIQEVSPGLFQVLGSHTYAAHDWYTITVTISQGWGGMAANTRGAGEAVDKPKVTFWAFPLKAIGGRQQYSEVQKLEVSRWGNAFINTNKNPTFVKNFVAANVQRFYVQVYDPVAWKNPMQKIIKVHVSTSSDTGQEITLTKQVQGGVFKSAPLLLTTFGVDKQKLPGQAFNVKLGDTIAATSGELEAEATVPVLKVVHLQINILRLAAGGDPVTTKIDANADVVLANRIYAAAGIRLIIDRKQYVNPPAGVDLSSMGKQGLGRTLLAHPHRSSHLSLAPGSRLWW